MSDSKFASLSCNATADEGIDFSNSISNGEIAISVIGHQLPDGTLKGSGGISLENGLSGSVSTDGTTEGIASSSPETAKEMLVGALKDTAETCQRGIKSLILPTPFKPY